MVHLTLRLSLAIAGLIACPAIAMAQDEPFCFAIFSSGEMVDLTRLCQRDRPGGHSSGAQAYQQGQGLSQAERHGEAVPRFNQAIQLDPNSAAAFRSRAHAQVLTGNRQAAVSDFEQAAALYRRQGDVAQASLLEQMATESRAVINGSRPSDHPSPQQLRSLVNAL